MGLKAAAGPGPGPGPGLDLSSCCAAVIRISPPEVSRECPGSVSRVSRTMVGEMEKPRASPDYLMQLMNDKKLMSGLPNFCGIFTHLERLLDEGETPHTPVCLSVTCPSVSTSVTACKK